MTETILKVLSAVATVSFAFSMLMIVWGGYKSGGTTGALGLLFFLVLPVTALLFAVINRGMKNPH